MVIKSPFYIAYHGAWPDALRPQHVDFANNTKVIEVELNSDVWFTLFRYQDIICCPIVELVFCHSTQHYKKRPSESLSKLKEANALDIQCNLPYVSNAFFLSTHWLGLSHERRARHNRQRITPKKKLLRFVRTLRLNITQAKTHQCKKRRGERIDQKGKRKEKTDPVQPQAGRAANLHRHPSLLSRVQELVLPNRDPAFFFLAVVATAAVGTLGARLAVAAGPLSIARHLRKAEITVDEPFLGLEDASGEEEFHA